MKLLILCALSALFFEQPAAQELKYSENYSIACHNCYEPQYASTIEDALSYTNTIEIDIWDSEMFFGIAADIFGAERMEKDWYVRHEVKQRGNFNNCGGTFKKYLEKINKWSNENPGHEVVTVFIDKKENWSGADESRKPADLDELILSVFDKEKVFTPSALLKGKMNLREAARNNWVSLDSLKGKFVFVITDATFFTSRSPLNEYLDARKNDAVCFAAPEITGVKDIPEPQDISTENADNIIIYNLHYSERKLAEAIHSLSFISRVYGAPETEEAYNELRNLRVNFIAMYNYKLDNGVYKEKEISASREGSAR